MPEVKEAPPAPPLGTIPRPAQALPPLFRAMRMHQWVKNLLIFVPIVTAHRILDPTALRAGLLGAVIFSLVASSHYLINDVLDLSSDRLHHTKRLRPIASGALSVRTGILFSAFLLLVAVLGTVFTPPLFQLWLLGYFVLTNIYSFLLKRRLLVDVLGLGTLYAIRIMAGGAIANIEVSEWLIAFSMFFFTSLAFTKRFTELKEMVDQGKTGVLSGRAWQLADLDLVRVVGPVSGLMAIVIMALYINSSATPALYHHPRVLWLLCPLLAYWIMRVWFIANRGQLHHDPVVFALRDSTSYMVGLAAALTMILATI